MSSKAFFYIFGVIAVMIPLGSGHWIPSLRWGRQFDKNGTETLEGMTDSSVALSDNEGSEIVDSTTETEMLSDSNIIDEEKVTGTNLKGNEVDQLVQSTISINQEISTQASALDDGDQYLKTMQQFNQMNEKIVLTRTNCHLEIPIHYMEDTKIEILFGPPQSNTSGKCDITLNGQENTMLGVLISDVQLYSYNSSQEEVLKVVAINGGNEFVLKEYYGSSDYQPLLLTETHKVYVILHYNVSTVTNANSSHFNLEIFSYHKGKNYVQKSEEYKYKPSAFKPNTNSYESIYFTTEYPNLYNFNFW